MRREGHSIIELPRGDILSYVGETKGHRDVGFYINRQIKPYVEETKGINERIIVAKLRYEKDIVAIFQTYAPTENSSNDDN